MCTYLLDVDFSIRGRKKMTQAQVSKLLGIGAADATGISYLRIDLPRDYYTQTHLERQTPETRSLILSSRRSERTPVDRRST